MGLGFSKDADSVTLAMARPNLRSGSIRTSDSR